MKAKIISLILIFAMVFTSSLSLVACNNDNGEETSGDSQTENKTESQDTEDPTNDRTESTVESESQTDVTTIETESQAPVDTSSETESGADTESSTATESESSTAKETESETEQETETRPDLDLIVYENGDAVESAGITWGDDEFASVEHLIDESKAVTKTAAEMLVLLEDINLMAEGEVYRVTEPLILEGYTNYYGNLAAIIAEGGIIIENCSNIIVKDLIVKGNITVSNSAKITFLKLDIKGDKVGVSIDKNSYDVAFKNCRISASDTAITSHAPTTSIYQSALLADKGLVSIADNLTIQDSHISAISTGVSISGGYCTVRNCLIELANDGVGVDVLEGSSNVLVALNAVKDAQKSIRIRGGFNCVVLLNSAIRVIGEDTTNLYVVENKLGGAIECENNKYLLCDGNTFNKDSKAHPVVNISNSEMNGDNLHDVDARVEYGANEDLLPHTNKDLFIDMDRKQNVTDLTRSGNETVNQYVRAKAQLGDTVIIPPGAYSVDEAILFQAAHSNTTLYGYGVYFERTDRDLSKNSSGAITQSGTILQVFDSDDLSFKGLTVGYAFQSSGQIHVVEKLGKNQLRVITNAGYVNDFGPSDPDNFGSTLVMFAAGEMAPWNQISNYSLVKNPDGTVFKDLDNTMILEIDDSKLYSAIGVGDVFTCRLSGDNSSTVRLGQCDNVLLKDCVVYGYSSALAIVGASRASGIKIERVHNTAHSQTLIDEYTYRSYIELEDFYGVDLEVSIDEQNRYRGGFPRTGSVDGIHVNGAKEGVSATSCILEQMCDDGSNQRADSSRIAGYRVNSDGTTTIYIKGTISSVYYNRAIQALSTSSSPTSMPAVYAGDRLYSYTSSGKIFFDTVALIDARIVTYSPATHISHIDKRVNSTIAGTVTQINGIFDSPTVCVDGLCDICGKVTHIDTNSDDTCDLCEKAVHTDLDKNGWCDHDSYNIKDTDGDGFADIDGAPIIYDMFHISKFNSSNGQYEVTSRYIRGGSWRTITYKMYLYEVLVKTEDVNFEALEGYDLTDNEYTMDNKVIIDNLGANAMGYTFDNVLIQNKTSRGMLVKSHDILIKNCTFRKFLGVGILKDDENGWGESSVPKNVTITGCLFDDIGRHWGDETKYCITIYGPGTQTGNAPEISDDTLLCKNIKIISNKFTNLNSMYAIAISGAQDIVIEDNIFEARAKDTNRRFARAIYIDGGMNISISGNTYSSFAQGDITKAVVLLNYKNLSGADIGDKFPKDNLAK